MFVSSFSSGVSDRWVMHSRIGAKPPRKLMWALPFPRKRIAQSTPGFRQTSVITYGHKSAIFFPLPMLVLGWGLPSEAPRDDLAPTPTVHRDHDGLEAPAEPEAPALRCATYFGAYWMSPLAPNDHPRGPIILPSLNPTSSSADSVPFAVNVVVEQCAPVKLLFLTSVERPPTRGPRLDDVEYRRPRFPPPDNDLVSRLVASSRYGTRCRRLR